MKTNSNLKIDFDSPFGPIRNKIEKTKDTKRKKIKMWQRLVKRINKRGIKEDAEHAKQTMSILFGNS